MNLKERMTGLQGPLAIEVAHLLFRYLTHRLDEEAFRRLFLVQTSSSRDSEKAYDIALATIRGIEEEEGTKIEALSPSTRRSYVDQLAKLSNSLQPARVDPVLRDEAERELQLFRSM